MTSPVFSVAGPILNISGSGANPLTRPAVNPGDLMLMRYALPFSDATFSPDAAWTLVDKYDPSGVFQCEIGVYWKIAGASEPSTYTVSISGQGGGNNLGSAQILVYTGGASASVVNAHTNANGTASTTIANPSVTTTVADTILIAYYGDRTDLSSETFAPASGMTQRATGRSADGVPWAWDDQPIATAGATGTKNATASASHNWMSVVFAIAPASAGGGGAGTTPTLTSPTATAISSTQASYSVTTNEAGGTLYRLFSTNATETAATIKAANLTQVVAAAGAQTGNTTVALSPSTTYYGHFVYVDGSSAQSAPVDTASFTTPAAPIGATAVTLSGPTGGVAGVASTNFTAGANGTITGTVVVTPSDAGAGGTFTPTTVSLTSGAPTATFTYTPSTAGTKTISVTNNGSLTNPGAISYAATSANTASFTCDVMINNANSIYKSQSVVWSWHQAGRIGQTSTSVTYGTGTINASGALVLTGLPAGAGFGLVAVRNTSALDDNVYYQAGTAA